MVNCKMMKRYLLLWWSVCSAIVLQAQDHGIQWVQGDAPISIMDFRDDTIARRFITNDAEMFIGTANICDEVGNFLFFTNGIYVRDRNGNMMPNGDSLGHDPILHAAFNNVYQSVYQAGAPNMQGVMILPAPEDKSAYYIFHYMPIDTSFLSKGVAYGLPTRLYYSIVNMNENFGLGAVTVKNEVLYNGLLCASRMTAVKHGNGRDWWIIRHGFLDNTYYKFLLTPDGLEGPFVQNIGPVFGLEGRAFDYYGTSVFNQTGDKMATANQLGPLVLLDFDRCSGEFSNPEVIKNIVQDTLYGAMGLAFSPNGRFLYVSNKISLNQYDLWNDNLNDSVRLFTETDDNGYAIKTVQLAPNGKVYIATWHGGLYALHVVNNPDELGLACNFEFAGQPSITANTVNLPNMVNYKLSAAVGSGCDTVVSSLGELGIDRFNVSVSPNPASDFVRIEASKNGRFELYNAVGQMVLNYNWKRNDNLPVSVSQLPSGIYNYQFVTGDGEVSKGKLVKE